MNSHYTTRAIDLATASVIGFFSLPSPSLAEHNPSAYNAAMSEAPAGAGSCAHCGTGILHHVIVRAADGRTAFIGTSCAAKVGCERVQRCVRERVTDEQLAERERKAAERAARFRAENEAFEQRKAERYAALGDIIDVLESQKTEFHSSLARDLRVTSLTPRQAEYAVKAVLGRRVKRNATEWDAIYERCVSE